MGGWRANGHKQERDNRDSSVFQTGWRQQNITKHLLEHILVPDSNRIFMRRARVGLEFNQPCGFYSHHHSFKQTVTPKKLLRGHRGDVVH